MGGGLSTDSSLVNGLMIAKSRVDMGTPEASEGGTIAIIDGGLENAKFGDGGRDRS